MLQSEFQGFQGVAVAGLGSRSLDSSPLYGLNVSLKFSSVRSRLHGLIWKPEQLRTNTGPILVLRVPQL